MHAAMAFDGMHFSLAQLEALPALWQAVVAALDAPTEADEGAATDC